MQSRRIRKEAVEKLGYYYLKAGQREKDKK